MDSLRKAAEKEWSRNFG